MGDRMTDHSTKRDDWEGPVTDMREFGAKLAARRAELEAQGIKNRRAAQRWANRTESKRALLKAIEDAGGKW
jgi:hypothetical protein